MAYRYIGDEISFNLRNEVSFVWGKVRRLFPLHIVTTLYCALFIKYPSFIASWNYKRIISDLPFFFSNLFLQHAWINDRSFNGVSWYLSVMVFLWVISLPILKMVEVILKKNNWYIFFLCVFVLTYFALRVWCYAIDIFKLELGWFGYTFPLTRLFEFMWGIMLGCIVRRSGNRIKDGLCSKVVFSIIELFSIFYWFYAPYNIVSGTRHTILEWIPSNLLIVIVFMYGRGYISELFSFGELVLLGDISAEAFLIHQIIIKIYNITAPGTKELSFIGGFYSLVASLVMTIIISYACHELMKKAVKAKE